MVRVRQPTSEYRRSIEDCLRWRDFEHRPDDIFISTPPKSGTTWMQGIEMVNATGAEERLRPMSPWDGDMDDLLDRYDALVADDLPADAAHWLESGSLATGTRPHDS